MAACTIDLGSAEPLGVADVILGEPTARGLAMTFDDGAREATLQHCG
jgi:hypothetical protein